MGAARAGARGLRRITRRIDPAINGALVAIEPETGFIKAMVGGDDWENNKLNLATGERGVPNPGRPSGSSFKVFTLIAALEAGISPQTMVDCSSPATIPNTGYTGANALQNIDNNNYGTISIQRAFAKSSNTGFVRLEMALGIDKVIATAKKMGIGSTLEANPSLTLGQSNVTMLDMASAYAIIANGGVRVDRSPTAADGAYSHDCGSCSSCKGVRAKLDSRHYVLGGALLSTAVFGFPVFCLVCPIGLTFATVLVVWRLFAAGDMTWSVVLIPLLLVVELVFLRKWCTRFCPMAGLMNLVSRFSKTWRPVIDESKCLETVNGAACSKCAIACEADINLRHPDFGERTLADCTRCRACVDACPAKAVSMPFLVKKGAGPQASTVVLADIDEKTAE